MPYITKERRKQLGWPAMTPQTEGELNYLVTALCINYYKAQGLSYRVCNDIVGALDNAKDEFRRRIQHPYEDTKIKANGDVY